MTCKDCIHRGLCDAHGYIDADDCAFFKNKADFVEVVRCEKCKHYVANYCTRDINGRTNMFRMNADDFCSYGERTIKE